MKLNRAKLIDLCFQDCSGQYGVPYSAEEYDISKYRYLRISDITDDGFLHNNDLKSVSGDHLENYLLKENDIVFARTGNSTGRSYLYDKRDGKLVYAGFLIKYSINPQKINPKYIRYFTQSSYYKQWVKNLSNGSTRGNINAQTFADCNIFFPDRTQQDILVNELDAINEKISLNTRMNAELEAMAKQLYDYWFVQFDFPDKNGKPYKSSGGKMVWNKELKREIPDGWEFSSTEKYATILRGSVITEAQSKQGKIKVVAAGITFAYYHNKANRKANVISISTSGANAGFINYWREPIYASDCMTLQCENEIDTFLCLMNLLHFQPRIYQMAHGSAQPHVYPEQIKDIPIVKIPIKLKNRIELFYKQINTLIANNDKEIENFANLRDSLLPMLMNGQVTIE